MRTDIRDRFYRTFTYQEVDRVPDLEFGYWPQTIRRWLKEGLPLELTEQEQNQMFLGKLDRFFGLESEGCGVPMVLGMNPWFEEEIFERKESSVVMRGRDGIVAERYLNDSDESSIPHYLSFPVTRPEDWIELKKRYVIDDTMRAVGEQQIADIRKAQAEGKSISVHMFPIEVTGGLDPYAWRKEFGMELRLRGGISKPAVAQGGSALDRELERIRPLFEQGGYIPHLDHLVPPDISYRNYCEYREKKMKLIGK